MKSHRHTILGIAFALGFGIVLPAQPGPESSFWKVSTPEKQGVDSSQLLKLVRYIDNQRKGLDGLLVIRHGNIVLETYYYPYTQDKEHILNSCTKSVVSALVGIAIDKGYLPGDTSRFLDSFPEATSADKYADKKAIEIKHLLTMTSGIDWPQYGSNNVSNQMDRSANWVRFILDRPMAAEPGSRSNYSNGDAHLLSALIEKVTGETTLDFAWKYLFQPLGIAKPRWDRDPQGINIGSATIYLTPRDMAKLGYLYLHDGAREGAQIIPAEWVHKSLQRHTGIVISRGVADYGYYWWLYPKLGLTEAWGGAGQRIGVFRDLDLVTVMTGDLADDAPVTSFSEEIYRQVLKAVKSPSELPENPDAAAELGNLVSAAALPAQKRAGSEPAVAGILAVLVACVVLWRWRVRRISLS